jgi:hypothetical protein
MLSAPAAACATSITNPLHKLLLISYYKHNMEHQLKTEQTELGTLTPHNHGMLTTDPDMLYRMNGIEVAHASSRVGKFLGHVGMLAKTAAENVASAFDSSRTK